MLSLRLAVVTQTDPHLRNCLRQRILNPVQSSRAYAITHAEPSWVVTVHHHSCRRGNAGQPRLLT